MHARLMIGRSITRIGARVVIRLVSALLLCLPVAHANAGNTAPVISGTPPKSATVGIAYAFKPLASDVDGNELTFSIVNRPGWANFDTSTGRLSGTPTAEFTHSNIVISVSDGVAKASLPVFSITVVGSQDVSRPVITGSPPNTVAVGAAYSFQPSATTATGTLTFLIRNKPGWAAFSSTTGRLSGTPTQAFTHSNIRIGVTNGVARAWLPTFAITVTAPTTNSPPVISGTPATSVLAGNPYLFQPSASDPNGDRLTFSIANQPTWASFDTTTGRLSGTPNATQAGSYANVTISVSDGQAIRSLPAFAIAVTAPTTNTPPVISGTPATSVLVGNPYVFQPSASDPNGDRLTFSIINSPSWATFDTTTGRLSGTPTASHVGSYANITVSVSDGAATRSLPAFTITVTAPIVNTPPVISGTPATSVLVGNPYVFQPTASDPNGDRLTFSIANPPSWAIFDTATGRLSGTPNASHVGSYANVTISVSDGAATRSLPAFTIAVNATALGSATVSWSAPTQNTDGSALTDLSGYRIYYGTSPTSMNATISINSAGTTMYVIGNLSPAAYYFAVTAINSRSLESDRSDTVSKVIN